MGMKEDYIKNTIDEAAKRGHEARIRDVAYALLRYKFDAKMAWMVVFGAPKKDNDIDDYESSEMARYLRRIVEKNFAPKEEKSGLDLQSMIAENESSPSEDIDFLSSKENRAGIEKQIEEILELKKKCPEDDIKTMALLQKTEADLRTKLNDKFGAADKKQQVPIYVYKTFDFECPWTRHECYQMDKKDAMKKWHLIPDPNYKED